jgi:hypothetical protein
MRRCLAPLLVLFSCATAAQSLPGSQVQYLLSEISGSSAQQLTLADGTAWQLNAPRALTRGSTILISSRNLNTGAEAQSGGFSFSVSLQNGALKPEKGSRLTLLAQHQDGKRLLLSEQLQAMVVDSDRILSRHFQGSQPVLVSEDGKQLIYLPTLTPVRIKLLSAAN